MKIELIEKSILADFGLRALLSNWIIKLFNSLFETMLSIFSQTKMIIRKATWDRIHGNGYGNLTEVRKRSSRSSFDKKIKLMRQTKQHNTRMNHIKDIFMTVASSHMSVCNTSNITLTQDKKQDFIIDGMNVLRAGTKGEKFTSVEEFNTQILKYLVPMIKDDLGEDSNIHIVMKGFPIDGVTSSTTSICQIMMASLQLNLGQNRKINLYFVSDEGDKERDDRLLILLKMRVIPEAIIISNDYFRSMYKHLDYSVTFNHCEIDLVDCMDIENVTVVKRILNMAHQIQHPKTFELKTEEGLSEEEKDLFRQQYYSFEQCGFDENGLTAQYDNYIEV